MKSDTEQQVCLTARTMMQCHRSIQGCRIIIIISCAGRWSTEYRAHRPSVDPGCAGTEKEKAIGFVSRTARLPFIVPIASFRIARSLECIMNQWISEFPSAFCAIRLNSVSFRSQRMPIGCGILADIAPAAADAAIRE
jgi:hypothetical protein